MKNVGNKDGTFPFWTVLVDGLHMQYSSCFSLIYASKNFGQVDAGFRKLSCFKFRDRKDRYSFCVKLSDRHFAPANFKLIDSIHKTHHLKRNSALKVILLSFVSVDYQPSVSVHYAAPVAVFSILTPQSSISFRAPCRWEGRRVLLRHL